MSYAPLSTLGQDYATVRGDARPSVSADAVFRFATKGMALFVSGAAPWIVILRICNVF